MIVQPAFTTQTQVDAAVAEVLRKKNPAALDKVRFEMKDHASLADALARHDGPHLNAMLASTNVEIAIVVSLFEGLLQPLLRSAVRLRCCRVL